jgi:hypothetical protein
VTEVAGETEGVETIVGEGERGLARVEGRLVVGERVEVEMVGPGGDVSGGRSVGVGEVDFRSMDRTFVNLEGDGIFDGLGGSPGTKREYIRLRKYNEHEK